MELPWLKDEGVGKYFAFGLQEERIESHALALLILNGEFLDGPYVIGDESLKQPWY